MSCLASEEVETCNCSEARFPINSSACFSEEQSEFVGSYLQYPVMTTTLSQIFLIVTIVLNESDLRSNEHHIRSSESEAWHKFRCVRDLNP